jgi:Pyridoxamine 5'-phosphate oxidase
MAKLFTELDENLRQFILAQHIFFNATAPADGRINVSPKGLDTLRILSDSCVAYLDLTGSENETAAHIAENGRLTLMFCSFEKKPLILRLYGKGRVVRTQDAEWEELHQHFPFIPGERQIILLDIDSILTSCGFAVPLYEYKGERETLVEYACKKGEEGMHEYRRKKNQHSLDGLPTYLFEDSPKS